jgi:hypothetical protein
MFDQPIRFIRQLDVGGEGRHPQAWNLNPRATKTVGPDAGQPIPNLIVGRAEAIPLPDGSVENIVVERTPLRDQSLKEIARVAAPSARVVLRHARPPWSDPHQRAADFWGPPVGQRLCQIAGQFVQESEFILSGEKVMSSTDGRRVHFKFVGRQREQLADLIRQHGARRAIEHATEPVCLATMLRIAREFQIPLKKGARPRRAA